MQRQAERMRGIIDDLLELSRLEGSHELAGDDSVDVAGLLTVLRRDVMSRPQHPTMSLILESRASLRGSESELASVLTNLVTNAVKYTPVTGTVDIRWWVDQHG